MVFGAASATGNGASFSVVETEQLAMEDYIEREEEEKSQWSVSTELTLYTNPWKISKELTTSDIGHLCRLLVSSEDIRKHLLPLLSTDLMAQVNSEAGASLLVWDVDTQTEHNLVFKRWSTSGSYVFIDKWRQDFIRRRHLRVGDEIGIYWDPYASRLNFTVLGRRF